MRRLLVTCMLCVSALLGTAGAAQALVVTDQGTTAGVAIAPITRVDAMPSGVTTMTHAGPCLDPALTQDLWLFGQTHRLPDRGLCYHGGPVMHRNETFALTWDAHRAYWSETRGYVEQFLRDVADGSGTLSSPYAVTQQYTDAGGRALNSSLFGGGCIDYGAVGGSACEFGNAGTGAGHDYPASGCPTTGGSFVNVGAVTPNDLCLTAGQVRSELSTMIAQTGMIGRTTPGYTPLVTLLLPPGVVSCLDDTGKLCSANGDSPPPPNVSVNPAGGAIPAGTYRVEITYVMADGESLPSGSQMITTTSGTSSFTIDSPPAVPGALGWYAYVTQPGGATFTRQQNENAIGSPLVLNSLTGDGPNPHPAHPGFCSFHSQVNVGGTQVAYVVLPWTAATACDEPDAPPYPENPTPHQLSILTGARLVSSLSQSQISAIVDPGLNAWSALDGSEIDDNFGCHPLDHGLDTVTVGKNSYLLQREFNNAGVIESEPNTYFGCAPDVILAPHFVVPSSVNHGDEVQFDGSTTASTLIVPGSGYVWNFGDGTVKVGPSVVHSFAKGGVYTVTLKVTDRGGYTSTISQTVYVLGPTGKPPSGGGHGGQALHARIQLVPQGLRQVLRSGVALRIVANKRATAIATLSIPRSAAKHAGIRTGRGRSVVIGRGTVRGISAGTVKLHLHLSRAMAAKLRRLKHLTVTVRIVLFAAAGERKAVVAAGRY